MLAGSKVQEHDAISKGVLTWGSPCLWCFEQGDGTGRSPSANECAQSIGVWVGAMVVAAGDDSGGDPLTRGGCPVALAGEVDFGGAVSPRGYVPYGGGGCFVSVAG